MVPQFDRNYDWMSQTVSELSAIDAPTRMLWNVLLAPYTVMILMFGWGVLSTAGSNRGLKWVGTALLVQALTGPLWPPMHLREVLAAGGGTLTDTLHLVFTALWGALSISAIIVGGLSLGRKFGIYSLATLVLLIGAGVVTSVQAPGLNTGIATPTIGIWERVNMAAAMAWFGVLSIVLARRASVLQGSR